MSRSAALFPSTTITDSPRPARPRQEAAAVRPALVPGLIFGLILLASTLNDLLVDLLFGSRSIGQGHFYTVFASPEMVAGLLLLPLSLYLGLTRSRPERSGIVPVTIGVLAAYTTLCLISNLVNICSPRVLIANMALFGYFYCAYRLTRACAPDIAPRLPLILLLANVAWLAFIAYFHATGRIWFNSISGSTSDIERLNVEGGRSATELALYLSFLIFYMAYNIFVARLKIIRVLSALVLAGNLFGLYILYPLNAIGAVLLLLPAFMLKAAAWRQANKRIRYLIPVVILTVLPIIAGAAIVSGFYGVLVEKLGNQGADPAGRASLYARVIDIALTFPGLGVGGGNLVNAGYLTNFPHQNILGTAAENGIPAAICYILYFILVVGIGLRIISVKRPTPTSMLALLGLACCIACELQGLTLDTLATKQTFWWAGAIVGIFSYSYARAAVQVR